MKYKAYFLGSKCKVPGSKVFMGSPKYPKHRAEIETWLDNMDDPVLTDNHNGTVTLSFTPVSQELATWIVQSKTTFFNIVRQHIGHARSKYSQDGHRSTKHTVRDYFPYEWDYVEYNNDCVITNTDADRSNRRLTVEELTSGSITRSISHLYNLSYSNSWSKARDYVYDRFYLEFYIGIVYYDYDNIPTLYRMSKFDIPWSEFNS